MGSGEQAAAFEIRRKLEKAEGALLPQPDESKHADPAAGHEGVRKDRTHLADTIGRLLAGEERRVRG